MAENLEKEEVEKTKQKEEISEEKVCQKCGKNLEVEKGCKPCQ